MTANIKKSTRYQLSDVKKALIIYYIIITAIQVLNWVISLIIRSSTPTILVVGNSSTVDMTSTFFLFVIGLCTFKENFGMLLQNGFSRRSVLTGRLLSYGVMALVMTVVDRVLTLLFNLIGKAVGGFANVTAFELSYGPGGFGWQMLGLLYTLLLYLEMLLMGYCISLMFYRLSKLGKVLVGAGVPVLVLIVGPVLDLNFTGGKVYTAIGQFFMVAFGYADNQPWYAVITLTVISLLASLCAWLMMRRATVRK
ncbi:hypothetical protein LJC60_05450 [Ruminococcaceae bacterium OttesenSCG-928-D13]|nr:hypothetical protein [Ruminococcaceae bacterium OttesenSCG-928-D13]